MDPLQKIEDPATRAGLNAYKTQMEIVVLSLLRHDRQIALIQIAEARRVSLDHIKTFDAAFPSMNGDASASRVAIALLEHSFERLRTVIEAPDDDEPAFGTAP